MEFRPSDSKLSPDDFLQLADSEAAIASRNLRSAGMIVLLKDHPRFNEHKSEFGIFRQEFLGGLQLRQIEPTSDEVCKFLFSEFGNSPGPYSLVVIDYCHSYTKLELSFPNVLSGLQAVGYDITSLKFEDPRYKGLAKAVKCLNLYFTEWDYARLRESRAMLAKVTEPDMQRVLREDIARTLASIKQRVRENLEYRERWVRELEWNAHWPRKD